VAKASKAPKSDQDILKEARARFKEAIDADSENRQDALDDIKFLWNLRDYQWNEQARQLRKGRPMLTENRLPQYVRMVVNAQRQNRPAINIAPAGDGARVEVAEVMEGMVRHIERWSRADLAYDSSFESAVSSGLGHFRITTDYVGDEGDEQEICIKSIDNSFSVYDDPHYTVPDGSDRKWCFITEWVPRTRFKDEYGFEPLGISDAGTGDGGELWFEEERVLVAEYWRLVKTDRKKVVEQFLMTGDKIIKKSEWPGCYLPIIPVYGEIKNIEGKKYRKSLIRDAKDPARINNYFLSSEVEAVSLQPKAPFLGPVGAFETDADKWSNANAANHAYIQYDVVEGAPPPMRQEPPMFPAALRETRMASIEAMKAIMGIYDASLGARTNETSGVAIQERQEQGDNAVYHYIDNMVRAIRYAGIVIVDLLPKVYEPGRVVRILQPDGEAGMAAIGQAFINPMTMMEQPGYDLTGRYDVVVKAGPSFQTQREESRQALVELGKAYPPLFQLAGDILFKNMDFPDADRIADRLKPQSELPPQIQQQMQEMQQTIQKGQQILGKLQHDVQEKDLQLGQKDLEKQGLENKLQAKEAQEQMMAGDNSAEQMLRLQVENATLKIQLAEQRLELRAMELENREGALAQREEALNPAPLQ
jgi:hypothetical protein